MNRKIHVKIEMVSSAKAKLKEEILDVLKNQDDRLREFRSRITNKNVIIFIGNTRNGKSTLVSYVTGAPLIAFQDKNNHFRIEQIGQNGGPEIAHGALSQTAVPTVIEMRGNSDTLIIDAPGFDDNRGPLQEIINALYINQIKYAKGVRFVLVSDMNNIINDNINSFLNFIETVHAIMPDFVKLKEAVSIIFTKDCKQYSIDEIAKLLKIKILDVNGLRFKKDLIKHFVERKDLIGLFKMPTAEGPLTEEINVNVQGAIFKSQPIDLNMSDIRFGISKSARVVLLETYLEFFDVVMSLKETFENFAAAVLEKFSCFSKSNLMLLTEAQLNGTSGINNEMKNFMDEIEVCQLVSVMEIPNALNRLFIEDVNKVVDSIRNIGLEVPVKSNNSRDFNEIEEVHRQLEHISLIEKVVEANDKSRNILKCYNDNRQTFHRDIQNIRNNIDREIETREKLIEMLKKIPGIQEYLFEVNRLYLLASSKHELMKMLDNLKLYINFCNKIVDDISQRPAVRECYSQNIQRVAPLCSEIRSKIDYISRLIEQRENEEIISGISPPLVGIVGTLMLYTGFTYVRGLTESTQLTVFGSSALLFALFAWKSRYVRSMVYRKRLRYQQGRLLSSRTKLDNCWKNLI